MELDTQEPIVSTNKLSSSTCSTLASGSQQASDRNQPPAWNLSRHFAWQSWNDPALLEAVAEVETLAHDFDSRFRGKLKTQLEPSLQMYINLMEQMAKISHLLKLTYDINQTDEEMFQFKTQIDARLTKCNADHVIFYTLELGSLSSEEVSSQMTDTLRPLLPFIERQQLLHPHQLPLVVERALAMREPWASPDCVVDYYLKQLASSTYFFDGEQLSLQKILAVLMHPSADRRRAAMKTLNEGLHNQYLDRFAALSLNVVAGSWHIESAERQFQTLRGRRHLANQVPEEVVNALLEAVRTTGVSLSKRYYGFKRQLLRHLTHNDEFTWADRNAPLPIEHAEKKYTWEEAVSICENTFKNFSSTMHRYFLQQIQEDRIHAAPGTGKMSGAYCCTVTPDVGPFQMQTFTGEFNDISTLAHESGHAIHSHLSSTQGILQCDPPLTLAETASTFGEILVFHAMLETTTSNEERLLQILQRIDGIVNCVVRQCSFDRFEELVATARQQGVIPDSQFTAFWKTVIEEYYGKAGNDTTSNSTDFIFDRYDDVDHLWVYVTHFHQAPFYVYSYAFAELVTGALYSVYQSGHPTFEENLINLLKAGSTKSFVEVLEPFGLFPDKAEFWSDSLTNNLGALIDEAETIAAELGWIQSSRTSKQATTH